MDGQGAVIPPGGEPSKHPAKVHLYGLSVLHDGGAAPTADIVLVHGIQGHPKDTWTYTHGAARDPQAAVKKPSILARLRLKQDTSKSASIATPSASLAKEDKGECFWPEQLLPADFPNCRILTFGYESIVSHFFSGSASQNGIMEYGNDLLKRLAAERRATTLGEKKASTRKIIFVAHSMGGLVVKEALRLAKGAIEQNKHLRNIFDCTFAIMFFSTPHRGSAYANLGLLARQVAVASGLSANDSNLKNLKPNAEYTRMLADEFANILVLNTIYIDTFQESKGYGTFGPFRGRIVEPDSSSLDYGLQSKETIEANHVDMCRFYGSEDNGYIKVKQALELHLEKIPKQAEEAARNEAELCLKSLDIGEMNLRLNAIRLHFQYTDKRGHTTRRVESQQWLWDDAADGPGLARWLRGGEGLFWIRGKPGSGKSTVMKNLWENDRTLTLLPLYSDTVNITPPWLKICAFFHDRGSSVQKSLTGVLSKLFHQIISKHPELIRLIIPFGIKRLDRADSGRVNLEKTKSNEAGASPQHISQPKFNWSFQSLRLAFLEIMGQTMVQLNILALVDALDEHEKRNTSVGHREMVNFFEELVNSTSRTVKLKVIVSSRPETVFNDSLGQKAGFSVEKFTRPDIDEYIQGTIGIELGVPFFSSGISQRLGDLLSRASTPSSELYSGDPQGQFSNSLQTPYISSSRDTSPSLSVLAHSPEKQLMVEIASQAHGVFLWVELVVNELLREWRKKHFISALTKKLAELPQKLQELYEYILKRISLEERKTAYISMELVLRSQRNLSLLELILIVQFFDDFDNREAFLGFLRELCERIGAGPESRGKLCIDLYRILQNRSHGLLEVQGVALNNFLPRMPRETSMVPNNNSVEHFAPEDDSNNSSTSDYAMSLERDPQIQSFTADRILSSHPQAGPELQARIRRRLGHREHLNYANSRFDSRSSSDFEDFEPMPIHEEGPKYMQPVQFLHQTAKEYLNDSEILPKVFAHEAEQIQRFQGGEMMFLTFCLNCLRASEWDRIKRLIKYDARKEVMLYAPLIEEPTTTSSNNLLFSKPSPKTCLLNDLDQELRKSFSRGEFWPANERELLAEDKYQWKTNFLCFAITHKMRNYVAETLNQYPHLAHSKSGRPLLHYAVHPNCSPALVADLIAHRANVHAVFKEEFYKKTAIQSINFQATGDYDNNGEPFLEAVKILLSIGANPNSQIYDVGDTGAWKPLLHQILLMEIKEEAKVNMLEVLKERGAKIDAQDCNGLTALEILSSSGALDSERTELLYRLLRAGARITKRMDHDRGSFSYFPWNSEEYTTNKYFASRWKRVFGS